MEKFIAGELQTPALRQIMNAVGEHRPRTGARRWLWVRRPAWIVIGAFALRLAVVGILFVHSPSPWGVNEAAGIARAIVQGRGYATPFHDTNAPTAWLAPLYPILLSGVFRLFGIETAAAAIAAILLNVIASSLTAAVVFQLGKHQFGETAGTVAGWAWAMAPPLLFMPWLLWETCLSGMVLALAFTAILRLNGGSRLREWAWCGALWSVGALLNPALVAPLPALALDAAVVSRRWKGPALMIFVFALGVVPWTLRNFRAFGQFLPVRSNFWPEVYFGNVDYSLYPTSGSMLYQREGETAFASDLKVRSIDFVRRNPRLFAKLTWTRIVAFWMRPPQLQPYPLVLLLLALGGIVQAWRRRKRWISFTSVLVLYPLVYYVTSAFARHRYPIEPIMYILGACFICEFCASRPWRESMSPTD
jgi:ribosomal protein L24E